MKDNTSRPGFAGGYAAQKAKFGQGKRSAWGKNAGRAYVPVSTQIKNEFV